MIQSAGGRVTNVLGRSYVGNDVTHSTILDRACGGARVPTKIFLNIVPTTLVAQPPDLSLIFLLNMMQQDLTGSSMNLSPNIKNADV